MDFRKDINGLRALAVFGVVLFHFKSDFLPGGFAGVDVFFVISGFLMTSIIFRGLSDQSFSLTKFYFARAKRIIPALLVLCLIVLIIGWFFIIPPDYERLLKHAHKSLNFLSNVTYWKESGYFDIDSDKKWLLHTWSLSVEWQFYLLYPLLLLLVTRLVNISVVPKVILAMTFIGFLFCIYISVNWPSAAFYLLPTRAWEMLLGGVAFLYPRKMQEHTKKYFYYLGLSMIIACYLMLSSELLWPGYLSALPVIGTYLILIANFNEGVITHNPVAQFLGKTSYSTYLWHWPIFVALSHSFHELDLLHIVVGITFSLCMGWLSYRLVEEYWRKTSLFLLSAAAAYIFIYGVTFRSISSEYLDNKSNFYIPDMVLNSVSRAPAACFDKEQILESEKWLCSLGDKTRLNTDFVVMGDSHMYSQLPAFEQLAAINKVKGEYVGFSGCPPILGVHPLRSDQKEKNCFTLNNQLAKYVQEQSIQMVILSARWSYYSETGYNNHAKMAYLSLSEDGKKDKQESFAALEKGIKQTIKKYNEIGVIPYIILQVPQQKNRPEKLYYGAYLTKNPLKYLKDESVSLDEHLGLQQRVNNIFSKLAESKDYAVNLIDPAVTFCRNERCMVGDELVSYYFDEDHLSERGALHMLPQLTDALKF